MKLIPSRLTGNVTSIENVQRYLSCRADIYNWLLLLYIVDVRTGTLINFHVHRLRHDSINREVSFTLLVRDNTQHETSTKWALVEKYCKLTCTCYTVSFVLLYFEAIIEHCIIYKENDAENKHKYKIISLDITANKSHLISIIFNYTVCRWGQLCVYYF